MPATVVLFAGDSLVTGHPLCRRDGPQRLVAVFSHCGPRSPARSTAC